MFTDDELEAALRWKYPECECVWEAVDDDITDAECEAIVRDWKDWTAAARIKAEEAAAAEGARRKAQEDAAEAVSTTNEQLIQDATRVAEAAYHDESSTSHKVSATRSVSPSEKVRARSLSAEEQILAARSARIAMEQRAGLGLDGKDKKHGADVGELEDDALIVGDVEDEIIAAREARLQQEKEGGEATKGEGESALSKQAAESELTAALDSNDERAIARARENLVIAITHDSEERNKRKLEGNHSAPHQLPESHLEEPGPDGNLVDPSVTPPQTSTPLRAAEPEFDLFQGQVRSANRISQLLSASPATSPNREAHLLSQPEELLVVTFSESAGRVAATVANKSGWLVDDLEAELGVQGIRIMASEASVVYFCVPVNSLDLTEFYEKLRKRFLGGLTVKKAAPPRSSVSGTTSGQIGIRSTKKNVGATKLKPATSERVGKEKEMMETMGSMKRQKEMSYSPRLERHAQAVVSGVARSCAWDALLLLHKLRQVSSTLNAILTVPHVVSQLVVEANIFTASFNLNGCELDEATHEWLPSQEHDICVVALQQVDPEHEADVLMKLQTHFGSAYTVVSSQFTASLLLVILVLNRHQQFVVHTQFAAAAWMHSHAAAAANSITFEFYGQSLCFVNVEIPAQKDWTPPIRNEAIRCLSYELATQFKPSAAPQMGWCELSSWYELCLWAGSLGFPLDTDPQQLEELYPDRALMKQADSFEEQRECAALFHTFSTTDMSVHPPMFPLAPRISGSPPEDETDSVSMCPWPTRILWRPASGVVVREIATRPVYKASTQSPHCPLTSLFQLVMDPQPLKAPPVPPVPDQQLGLLIHDLRAHIATSDINNDNNLIESDAAVRVVFSAHFLANSGAQTKPASPSLGLYEWSRSSTPLLRCVTDFNRAKAPLLHMDAFQDSDRGLIPVGSTAIRLHDADGAWIGSETSGTFEFKANLTLCGFPGGTITGRLGVHWLDPQQLEDPMHSFLGKISRILTTETAEQHRPIRTLEPARLRSKFGRRIDPVKHCTTAAPPCRPHSNHVAL